MAKNFSIIFLSVEPTFTIGNAVARESNHTFTHLAAAAKAQRLVACTVVEAGDMFALCKKETKRRNVLNARQDDLYAKERGIRGGGEFKK